MVVAVVVVVVLVVLVVLAVLAVAVAVQLVHLRDFLFCETSSIFEVDKIKNEAILRDRLQKWKVECRADGLVPMRFAIFLPFHLSKVLHTPQKSEARSYEVSHLSRKSS